MRYLPTLTIAVTGLLAGLSNAILTIQSKGAKLFTSDGNQFYIKGVAYQLSTEDPLTDGAQCQRDIALMKTIGTNAIRVYHVDPTANHDACMSAFAAAGIYTWIDLDTFTTYIIGVDPYWNTQQYDAFAAVMDAFQGYDNVAGFFVGNEVLNAAGAQSAAAPYVKAAITDMKAYRDRKGYRKFLIGYSAADIAQLRPNLQNYLSCGDSDAQRADFFSLNSYEWCGDVTYTTSGYSGLQAMAEGYNIPLFFSETGCNVPDPRTFADQSAILGPDMDGTWSGAIIYEWIQEQNGYGLVSYGAVGDVSGTPSAINPDWNNLSQQWATLSPTGVAMAAYNPTNSPPACPPYTAGQWLVSGDVSLPTLGAVPVSAPGSTAAAAATITSESSSSTSSTSSTSSSTASAASTSSVAISTPSTSSVSSTSSTSSPSTPSTKMSTRPSTAVSTTMPTTTSADRTTGTTSASSSTSSTGASTSGGTSNENNSPDTSASPSASPSAGAASNNHLTLSSMAGVAGCISAFLAFL